MLCGSPGFLILVLPTLETPVLQTIWSLGSVPLINVDYHPHFHVCYMMLLLNFLVLGTQLPYTGSGKVPQWELLQQMKRRSSIPPLLSSHGLWFCHGAISEAFCPTEKRETLMMHTSLDQGFGSPGPGDVGRAL